MNRPIARSVASLTILAVLLLAAVQGAHAQQGALVKPDARTQAELTRMFDLFRRVCEVEYFGEGEVTSDALIQFAILYNNNLGPYHKPVDNEGHYRLPAKYVEKIAKQYFGRGVEHHTLGDIVFSRGNYYPQGSDAGEGERIEISRLTLLGNNVYEVDATFYTIPDGEGYLKERMKLRKVTSKGRSRYVVLAYQKV